MKKLSKNKNLVRYRLIYRHFTYLGLEKLYSLYKVITIRRLVLVLVDREMYRVYKLTKL
jgi:hypothetical protein